jgi:Uma2 family endonuclease
VLIMATGLRDPEVRRWTHRDLEDMPDDGNRYEIIDGELYVTPFPRTGHQRAVTQLVVLLSNHVRAEDCGEVFTSGLMVVLDEKSGVGPDVVFLSKSQVKALERTGFYGPPEMVVEVLSLHRNLDIQIKRAKYERAGIPYYWIVDTKAQTLWEYRLENGTYVLQAQPTGEDEFRPKLFPGLVIPLGQLWGAPLPP